MYMVRHDDPGNRIYPFVVIQISHFSYDTAGANEIRKIGPFALSQYRSDEIGPVWFSTAAYA